MIFPSRFTDADPFKILKVDPKEISEQVLDVSFTWGRVSAGQWDKCEIASGEKWQALQQRYLQGKEWSDINIELSDTEHWDALYESITENGYQSQADLSNQDNSQFTWDCEIGVAIDADGSILWLKRGSHRLRFAKLLDVSEIPVEVRVRHRKWQEIRDEVRHTESKDELSEQALRHLDHPDLDDLRNSL